MLERKRLIAPSLLAADFTNIRSGIALAEEAEADMIHLDIMDGSFVPEISFGSQMAKSVRAITNLPLDTHLMVVQPASHIEAFADAGVDSLTFHSEVEVHTHRLIRTIQDMGMKAGISIVPSTPVSAIIEILDIVDQVLVMTVNPGYGGQSLIQSTLKKVHLLAQMREKGAGHYLIIIDGGFCLQTAADIWKAGTDMAVMGSAFYASKNPLEVLKECRSVDFVLKV